MASWTYIGAWLLVAAIQFAVFRIAVRRQYRRAGRLTPLSTLLQYGAIVAWVCFGCLNLPQGWPSVRTGPVQEAIGWVLFIGGWLATVAGIIRLGVRRSHGLQVDGLRQAGMYRLSRNPQTVAFLAAMIGYFLLWPTWRNAGVFTLVVLLARLMILTEEEHLTDVFGEEYRRYCKSVPRFLRLRRAAPAS